MVEFLPFFLVLLAGVFFSVLFSRLHLPWVVALIIAGIIIGPDVLGVYEPSETIEFMGQIGLVFLMFMAGLETRLARLREVKKQVFLLGIINGVIPLLVAFWIGQYFGYDYITSFVLGIIFVSSSVAVVIPSLEEGKLFHTRLGDVIIGKAIVEDILSLVLLSIFIQTQSEGTTAALPLPIFYLFIFFVLYAFRWALPKLENFFAFGTDGVRDLFQQQLRSVFVVLIGTVVSFELLGLHPIIAGFFAGLVLSDTIKSEVLLEKLRAISYGLFIPVFFVLIGVRMDLGIFSENSAILGLVSAIVVGSVVSKFVSGWLGAKLSGFNSPENVLIGVSTIPQLSTTLAVAFTGQELGFLTTELVTALIILSIVTTLLSPILLELAERKIKGGILSTAHDVIEEVKTA